MDIVQQQLFQRLIEKLMTRNSNITATTTTTTSNGFYSLNKVNEKCRNFQSDAKIMKATMETLKENHQIMDTNSSDDGLKNGR